ncbi:uncharacterized protein YkwD [Thermocatellispora tengchongensis]|uniref:Uncharacterized protein YkwD n=1 Tax=Thermocatellispora tengchongensis TaxID=1073253 RepID=A0A840P256_9ACTN|nr:CAP domain-containing protein [Thermocatellispora tengchongensis]MBB5132566.1 uncharacterized protein YkwD [Thermocatellispora tengchongensis]
MRRLSRALVCVGSLAALSIPVTGIPAQAASGAGQAATDACRLVSARPVATETSIRANVVRAGCTEPALVRIQIKVARFGPDTSVRRGKKVLENGQITTSARCSTRPRTYYVVATDTEGNVTRSRPAKLTCAPEGSTPVPAPTPDTTTTPNPSPTQDGATVGTAEENEVVRLTNAERAKAGCKALVHDAKLHTAALNHSKDMAANNYFSHTSRSGKTFDQRIKEAGFAPIRALGENIAYGYRTPAEVVKGWMNSSGHRANILNCSYTHIGVGMAKRGDTPYWTQDFGRH